LRIKKASKYWKNFGQIEAKAECSPSNIKTAVIGKMTQMAMSPKQKPIETKTKLLVVKKGCFRRPYWFYLN
jgi:hypothetical protein